MLNLLSLYGCPQCVDCLYKSCLRNNHTDDNYTASNAVNELQERQLFFPQNCYVRRTLNGWLCGWYHRLATRNRFPFQLFFLKGAKGCRQHHLEFILSEIKTVPPILIAVIAHHTPTVMPCNSNSCNSGIICRKLSVAPGIYLTVK